MVMFNLYNAKTPDKKIGNSINSNGTQVTHTFEGPIDQDAQMILEVVPPKAIVRLGGEYTVQAVAGMVFESGSTGAAVSVQDPILGRRFRTLYCNNTRDPACKLFSFEAGGSVVLPGGDRGTWRLFDAERGVYVIAAGGHRQSLKLKPGVGLVNVSDGRVGGVGGSALASGLVQRSMAPVHKSCGRVARIRCCFKRRLSLHTGGIPSRLAAKNFAARLARNVTQHGADCAPRTSPIDSPFKRIQTALELALLWGDRPPIGAWSLKRYQFFASEPEPWKSIIAATSGAPGSIGVEHRAGSLKVLSPRAWRSTVYFQWRLWGLPRER